jgi:hypothetical protein
MMGFLFSHLFSIDKSFLGFDSCSFFPIDSLFSASLELCVFETRHLGPYICKSAIQLQ